MTPNQCKREDEVMYAMQKWLDDERELVALGETEMSAGYRITALKTIATNDLRAKIDDRERDYI